MLINPDDLNIPSKTVTFDTFQLPKFNDDRLLQLIKVCDRLVTFDTSQLLTSNELNIVYPNASLSVVNFPVFQFVVDPIVVRLEHPLYTPANVMLEVVLNVQLLQSNEVRDVQLLNAPSEPAVPKSVIFDTSQPLTSNALNFEHPANAVDIFVNFPVFQFVVDPIVIRFEQNLQNPLKFMLEVVLKDQLLQSNKSSDVHDRSVFEKLVTFEISQLDTSKSVKALQF